MEVTRHNSELISKGSKNVLERENNSPNGLSVKKVYFLESICFSEVCGPKILFTISLIKLI